LTEENSVPVSSQAVCKLKPVCGVSVCAAAPGAAARWPPQLAVDRVNLAVDACTTGIRANLAAAGDSRLIAIAPVKSVILYRLVATRCSQRELIDHVGIKPPFACPFCTIGIISSNGRNRVPVPCANFRQSLGM